MNRWFRFYDEALNDPKILRLSDALYRQWTQVLCIASKNGGYLPDETDVTILMRFTSVSLTRKMIEELLAAELLDETDSGRLVPHNWRKRQYKSDVSTDRVKLFRKRKRNVSVTSPETETETETETEKKVPADAGYAFNGSVVRLRQKDFNDWRSAFPNLDLVAELIARDAWLASPQCPDDDRGKWFLTTATHLRNLNQRAKTELSRGKTKSGIIEAQRNLIAGKIELGDKPTMFPASSGRARGDPVRLLPDGGRERPADLHGGDNGDPGRVSRGSG